MHSVEKLWNNLWVSLRKSCGKILGKLWIKNFSTKSTRVFHRLGVIVEKFYKGFAQKVIGVRRGFYTVSTGLITTIIILR